MTNDNKDSMLGAINLVVKSQERFNEIWLAIGARIVSYLDIAVRLPVSGEATMPVMDSAEALAGWHLNKPATARCRQNKSLRKQGQ
jgi:hypothetical protein